MSKKRMTKEELIFEAQGEIASDLYNYHQLVLDSVERELRCWTVKHLKTFLGYE